MSPLSISAFNSETGMSQFRETCWTKDPEEVKIGDSDVRNEGGSLIFFYSVHLPAGSHDKPSLSAWPSPVVPNGQHVEFRCDSNKYNTFRLYKEHGEPIPQVHERMLQKSLLLGPVTRAYAGTYRCYNCNFQCPVELSSHSDPLEIIISGQRSYLDCHFIPSNLHPIESSALILGRVSASQSNIQHRQLDTLMSKT